MEHFYDLGVWSDVMPIPRIEENCIAVEAGPILLVVEGRNLTPEIVAVFRAESSSEPQSYDESMNDKGACLHIDGTDDQLEHLRFDCFEKDPHYHYIFQEPRGNIVCRFDEIANGDPISWAVDRVRSRLPEMLEFVGAYELSAKTRSEMSRVAAGALQVAELMNAAWSEVAR